MTTAHQPVELTPGRATLAQLEALWRTDQPAALASSARDGVDAAARIVADAAANDTAVYGVNTGFGKLASVKIDASDTARLQRNLILSHCCGVGAPLDVPSTRLMMALKLLSLGRGASGVRWEIIAQLEAMLAAGVTPLVPGQGSVGASGDLAPLAHMTAAMMGEGEAFFDREKMPAGRALQRAGLAPCVLGPKEGLGLINGTQFSTACALTALFDAWRNGVATIASAALSTDAIMGSTAPLTPEIHMLRGHAGQVAVARELRSIMAGSEIRESHRDGDARVQDPYCIRCQPQVTGAALDLLGFAGRTLEIEANAVTDNPLVLVAEGRIVSGGNFHAEPVAFAADQIALAISEIGAIAQRRVALMVDPALSFDLPPFLTPDPGLNSGLMIAEVTTAALMSENKHLATPCSTDSTPTSANQEDHVSMAAHAARRLSRMNANLATIIGVELICAAQGVAFRAPLQTSPRLQALIAMIREQVPPLTDDRFMAGDLEAAAELVRSVPLISFPGVGESLDATATEPLSVTATEPLSVRATERGG
ncbi:MAG: histidine ammonia-lyase [Pseudomonadota bacterium]